jgi:hypothetical protein
MAATVTAPTDRASAVGFAYLALVGLVPGLWGVVDPAGWFRDFPGIGGGHWLAADPPYNHHLTVDAAAGLLVAGAVALVAALWSNRDVRALAAFAVLVQATPHVAYHLAHPADALDGAQQLASTGGLALQAGVAAVLLVRNRPGRGAERSTPGG